MKTENKKNKVVESTTKSSNFNEAIEDVKPINVDDSNDKNLLISNEEFPDVNEETAEEMINEIGKEIVLSQPNGLAIQTKLSSSLEVLKVLVKSRKIPAKSIEEAFVYYELSKELNLPFISSMAHMQIINGKLGVDVHILKALLLRAGTVTWEKVLDYVPLYEYTDKVTTYWLNPINGENLDKFVFIPNDVDRETAISMRNEAISVGKIAVFRTPNTFVNTITKYKFTRLVKMIDGSHTKLVEYSDFSTSKKVIASLGMKDGVPDPYSPHTKYPDVMQDHRAFTYGARAIASDLLYQAYSKEELCETYNVPYDLKGEDVVILK
jgi:hypothetical protein